MKIEFIISCYQRPHSLTTILGCLQAQTSSNWVAKVYRDGYFEGYEKIKNFFIDDPRIKFIELDGPHNDWGHTPRNIALKKLTEEWVVMTGHDNYYVPTFVEKFLEQAQIGVNFVYCDMIHSHDNYIRYFNSEPRIGYIDIGNFMVRSDLASQMQINCESTTGDGEFVVNYISKFGGELKHINQALYSHN